MDQTLLAPLNHTETAIRVRAERAMNTRLEGGCQVPIGSYAELINGELWLRALVGAPDGSQMVRGERRGPAEDAEALGVSLAEELLDNGARDILAAFMMEKPLDEHSGHPSVPARRSAGQPSARMGRVAWSFPLIEFTPGRELPALGDQLARLGPAICCLRCPSMRWSLPMPAAAAGPALAHAPAILPLAARRRWPCIRSVGSIFATR
jgi:hypothetical protein